MKRESDFGKTLPVQGTSLNPLIPVKENLNAIAYKDILDNCMFSYIVAI